MRILLPLRMRVLLLTSVLTLAAAFLPTYVLTKIEQKHVLERYGEDMDATARNEIRLVQKSINDAVDDLRIIALTPPIASLGRALKAGGIDPQSGDSVRAWTDRLTIIFSAFAATHPNYDQIRLIKVDAEGKEMIRVDGRDGKAVPVAAADLQAKGDRDYFRDSVTLAPGEIYFSRINLNRERAQIEQPYKPTLRISLAVYHDDGRPFAILIINLKILPIMRQMALGTPRDAQLYVANSNGEWLVHPRSDYLYGADLGHGHGWDAAFAKTSMVTEAAGRGLQDWPKDADGIARLALRRGVFIDRNRPHHLFSMAYVIPKSLLRDKVAPLYRTAYWTSGILGVLMALLAVALVRRLTRPLTTLSSAARAIAEGRYDTALPQADEPELRGLIDSFDRLRQAVQNREAELTTLNGQLEARIASRTEELEKAKFAAETMAKVKGDFLSNMSHEIRTPLNAIIGLSHVLLQGPLESESSQLVRKIKSAGTTLCGIIDDILDISKLEAGKVELVLETVSIQDLIDDVGTIMALAARQKDLELVIRPDVVGVTAITADALRLRQILINLCNNAVKFTESGYVQLGLEKIDETETSVCIRFSVVDTGIGMTPEQRELLFTPFSQADASISRRFGGTGLGLSICRRLVELMGGHLQVESQFGLGSRFAFCLDFEKAEHVRYADPAMAQLEVVIADDSPEARDALGIVVSSLGWSAHVVGSGEEAIAAVQGLDAQKRSRLVLLLDWKMPGLDGLRAAQQLRCNHLDGTEDPIVIMVTAYDRDALINEPCSAFTDAVLVKPVTASALYDAVANIRGLPTLMAAANGSRHDERLAGLRLLVVDDSEINLEVARRIFVVEGCRVQCAASGAEALRLLEQGESAIDVVLMDVQMPEMNGYEATRRLHALAGYEKVPVIALTAGALPEQRRAALEAGMIDFIPKPFDVEKAVELLKFYVSKVPVASFDLSKADQRPKAVTPLPVLDEAQAKRVWGDSPAYDRYLIGLVDDGQAILALLDTANADEIGARLHKLKGAAGNLALRLLADRAGTYLNTLHEGGDLTSCRAALVAAMAQTSQAVGLRQPADGVGISLPTDLAAHHRDEAVTVLTQIRQCLDQDSPDGVEDLILRLQAMVPTTALEPLQAAVADFDFRAGEACVQALASRFGLLLET